ncbi:MAG: NADPH:quinone oxidoreductase family protein [Salinisphaera sp.]|nr:NADPH:quinone oxidoreductase family protein [Salinisphaera sp.]
MKAIVCQELGPPSALHYGNLPDPKPGKGEVLIAARACGVNFPDTLIIQGRYQFKPGLPFAPGSEVAGEVVEVGEGVEAIQPGDRVMSLVIHGAFAEYVVARAATVVPIPEGLDFAGAAAFPMAFGTSMYALQQRGALQKGETLLVLGAAGGVGLAAVQIGKALGARVIAAASSVEKLALCGEHGADEGVNYTDDTPLKDQVKALTDGRGADVIYDAVGGDAFDQALSAINWNGRLLVVGFASGTIPKAAANRILLKGASVVGVFWGRFSQVEPQENMANFAQLARWYAEGRIRPLVTRTYPLQDAAQALDALLARTATGKLVLEVTGDS